MKEENELLKTGKGAQDPGDTTARWEALQTRIKEWKGEIGEAFYRAYARSEPSEAAGLISICQEIAAAEKELALLEKLREEEARKVFCPACGKELEEGSRFCSRCGVRTDRGEGAESPEAIPAPEREKKKKPKKKGGKALRVIKVFLLLLLLTAVINMANNFLQSLRSFLP